MSIGEILNELNKLNDENKVLNCKLKRKTNKLNELGNFNVELMNEIKKLNRR